VEHKLRVFEYRVLRKIFGHKRDEVTGECRKLYELELNDLYSSPGIFSGDQIKKNEISVACSMHGGGEVYTGFWWGNLRESDLLEYPGVGGGIILKWIFRKWSVGVWTGLIWLRIGTGSGLL